MCRPKNVMEAKETWKLVDDVGVSRILGISDQSGLLSQYCDFSIYLILNLSSFSILWLLNYSGNDVSNVEDTEYWDFLNGTSAIPVYLGIPNQKHSASDDASEAFSEAKAKWLDAFGWCS